MTIIATCLVDTGRRLDESIYEEFVGTGNMGVRLDLTLAQKEIWPAILIPQSRTRLEKLLLPAPLHGRIVQFRRPYRKKQKTTGDLIKAIERSESNAELLGLETEPVAIDEGETGRTVQVGDEDGALDKAIEGHGYGKTDEERYGRRRTHIR